MLNCIAMTWAGSPKLLLDSQLIPRHELGVFPIVHPSITAMVIGVWALTHWTTRGLPKRFYSNLNHRQNYLSNTTGSHGPLPPISDHSLSWRVCFFHGDSWERASCSLTPDRSRADSNECLDRNAWNRDPLGSPHPAPSAVTPNAITDRGAV